MGMEMLEGINKSTLYSSIPFSFQSLTTLLQNINIFWLGLWEMFRTVFASRHLLGWQCDTSTEIKFSGKLKPKELTFVVGLPFALSLSLRVGFRSSPGGTFETQLINAGRQQRWPSYPLPFHHQVEADEKMLLNLNVLEIHHTHLFSFCFSPSPPPPPPPCQGLFLKLGLYIRRTNHGFWSAFWFPFPRRLVYDSKCWFFYWIIV